MRNMSEKLEEKQENMRLNSVNSRKTSLETGDLLKSNEHLHHQKILFIFFFFILFYFFCVCVCIK